ncbi:MAG TPA: histidine kinase [Casimicrobiaceae bacterium]|nr:histidine kinase [Casimicrobiaceae bacterium]
MREAIGYTLHSMFLARLGSGSFGSAVALARRLAHALRSEPRWLRGVHWRLVGMIGLIALIASAKAAYSLLLPTSDPGRSELACYLFELLFHASSGLFTLLIAAFLTTRERKRLPTPVCLAIAVLLGTLGSYAIYASAFAATPDERLWMLMLLGRRDLVLWSLGAAAWYSLHRATLRETALRASEVGRRSLETGMLEARLQALQAQVEPHFLFNTLAHVRRLYRTDPVRARRMLDSFRDYLESALPQMRDGFSTIGREVDLARAYLDVQQVRMGRRLHVGIDVADELRRLAFPPMMLISLVENAIKHGLDPVPGGGTIRIDAQRHDGFLEVAVIDTGRGIGEMIGSGVGLANIRGRLSALFDSQAELSLAANARHGVRASIRVPAKEAASARAVDVDETLALVA